MKLFTLLTLFFVLACASSNRTTPESAEGFKAAAAERLGAEVSYAFNPDSTHVLCVKKAHPSADDPLPDAQFVIYDLRREEVVFQDRVANASVKWLNAAQVQVVVTPGIVKGDEAEPDTYGGYIFDVKRGRKLYRKGGERLDQ